MVSRAAIWSCPLRAGQPGCRHLVLTLRPAIEQGPEAEVQRASRLSWDGATMSLPPSYLAASCLLPLQDQAAGLLHSHGSDAAGAADTLLSHLRGGLCRGADPARLPVSVACACCAGVCAGGARLAAASTPGSLPTCLLCLHPEPDLRRQADAEA